MRVFVLFSFLFSAMADAADTCKHDPATARAALMKIHAGQKALFAQQKAYSDDFGAIGFDPNMATHDDDCDLANWSFELEPVGSDQQFKATAYSRVTREEYSIDESNGLKKKEMTVSFTAEDN